ncbi:hypothetical protein VCRA2123E76_80029 [Vibrio crassostreae]|nr:hypothetical protein VCRA2123E76_80029 [Vibrio crassostreae]
MSYGRSYVRKIGCLFKGATNEMLQQDVTSSQQSSKLSFNLLCAKREMRIN